MSARTPGPLDPFAAHKEAIRARGNIVTPYRVGLESGYRDDGLPCPYTHHKSNDSFRVGVRNGRERRINEQRAARRALEAAGVQP